MKDLHLPSFVLLGFTEQWMLHILAPPFVFCVSHQAWYEVLIAVAKVDREGDIISCETVSKFMQ